LATVTTNIKSNRTWKKDGVIEIDDSVNQNKLEFITGMAWKLDANLFDEDHIGDGEAVYTQKGDIIGNFEVDMMHTVDLLTGTINTTKEDTIQFWLEQIADIDPPIIKFIETLSARKSVGNKKARYRFSGRIMTPEIIYNEDNAIDQVKVAGNITAFTSGLRQAS